MKYKAEQGVPGYSPQVASPQNADVGSTYMNNLTVILCVMMATSICPIAGYAADTNDAPSPAMLYDRTWTIDGHSMSHLHYLGIEDRNGTLYAFFTSKRGGGPRRFTLDLLSTEDIEAIKKINPTLEPRVIIKE